MGPAVERHHLRHTTFVHWDPHKSSSRGITVHFGFILLAHVGKMASQHSDSALLKTLSIVPPTWALQSLCLSISLSRLLNITLY